MRCSHALTHFPSVPLSLYPSGPQSYPPTTSIDELLERCASLRYHDNNRVMSASESAAKAMAAAAVASSSLAAAASAGLGAAGSVGKDYLASAAENAKRLFWQRNSGFSTYGVYSSGASNGGNDDGSTGTALSPLSEPLSEPAEENPFKNANATREEDARGSAGHGGSSAGNAGTSELLPPSPPERGEESDAQVAVAFESLDEN